MAKQEKFVPAHEQNYWFLDSDLVPRQEQNDNEPYDKAKIRIGNCFKSRKAAREAAVKVKETLAK